MCTKPSSAAILALAQTHCFRFIELSLFSLDSFMPFFIGPFGVFITLTACETTLRLVLEPVRSADTYSTRTNWPSLVYGRVLFLTRTVSIA